MWLGVFKGTHTWSGEFSKLKFLLIVWSVEHAIIRFTYILISDLFVLYCDLDVSMKICH